MKSTNSLGGVVVLALAVTAGVAVWSAGCGGSQPEFADVPQPDAGPPPSDASAAPPPPPPDAGIPAVQAGPCDPVQTLAMTTMFQTRAAAEAPGMEPEGALACGVVPENQPVSTATFTLQQGYCYTILGHGLPTVSEVDMQLVPDLAGQGASPQLQALLKGPALSVDTETGVQAVIGKKQSCYEHAFPFPVPVKVEVKARSGSGPVAAQVYKKKKK